MGKDNVFGLSLLELQQVEESEVSCWYPLFESGVIAHGFPVPPREGELGIELPFGVMASLARITYPMEMYDGIILKGPSTALIPIKRFPASTASVQWHFITTDSHDLQLTMDSVAKQIPAWYETTDFELLTNARTFLGCCKNATIHLGTKDSGYENVKRSNAVMEPDRLEFSKEILASFRSSGMGIIGAMLGLKVVYPKALLGTTKTINLSLKDRLRRSTKQPLLMYDTETKRGWLVPELSAVLHLAHIWDAYCLASTPEQRNVLSYSI